jgi:rod shape-determining protein MreC
MFVSWKKRKNLIILLSLILLQLILISVQAPIGEEDSYFEQIVFSIFSPLQHGVVSFFQGIGGFWKNYAGLRRVHEVNEELEEDVFFLRQRIHLLQSELKIYKTEKEIFDLFLKLQKSVLPARVIGMDTSNMWRSLVINKGSLDGVKKNMVVLDKNGYLVGRIVHPISFREARVQMITDTETGVSVVPEGKEVPGILTGEGNGKCRLEFVLSTDTTVAEGDRLITAGFDGIYFPGIEVGKVISVVEEEGLFKTIHVEPTFMIQDIDLLAIITVDTKEFF